MQTHQSPPHHGGGPPSETLVAHGSIEDPDEGKAQWTQVDKEELICFLIENKTAAGDGENFKKTMWTAAAAHMRQFTSKGGTKTADSCKNKWARVTPYYLFTPLSKIY